MSSTDSTSLYIAIIALLIGVLGLPPLYKEMFDRRKERNKVTFTFEKFMENGDTFLRVHNPDKLIRHLIIFCDGTPCLPKDNPSKSGRFDIQIVVGGGANFALPNYFNSQSKIVVKDGDKKLEEFIFKNIPEAR